MKKGFSSCYASQFKPVNQPPYSSVTPLKNTINVYQKLKADYYQQILINPSDDFDAVLKALGDYHAINKNKIDESVSAYLFLDTQLFAYEQLDFDSLNAGEKVAITEELNKIKNQMVVCLRNDEIPFQQYDIVAPDEIENLMNRLQAIVNPADNNKVRSPPGSP